jgi:lipopolysaccharide transport system permease protein
MSQYRVDTAWPAITPLGTIWRHRSLIWQLASRDVEARYRASVLGVLWAVALPVALFAVYLFVFTTVLRARWETPSGTQAEVALFIFSGLLLFTLLAETVNRAPYLITEAPHFVKKVVFPVEILPIVALLSAILPFLIGAVILLATMVAMGFGLPWTIVYYPLLIIPIALLALGSSWLLSAMAVYLPDLRHVVGVVVTMLLFLTPIFYPASALPPQFSAFNELNPIAWTIESSKDVLFWGRAFAWRDYAFVTAASALIAWFGYGFFMASKRGFADVM